MYSGSRSSKGSAAGGLRATWRGSAAWATSADMAPSIRASAESAPRIRPIPPPRRPRTSTGSARRCACRSVVCGMKRLLGRLRPYGRGRCRASVRSTGLRGHHAAGACRAAPIAGLQQRGDAADPSARCRLAHPERQLSAGWRRPHLAPSMEPRSACRVDEVRAPASGHVVQNGIGDQECLGLRETSSDRRARAAGALPPPGRRRAPHGRNPLRSGRCRTHGGRSCRAASGADLLRWLGSSDRTRGTAPGQSRHPKSGWQRGSRKTPGNSRPAVPHAPVVSNPGRAHVPVNCCAGAFHPSREELVSLGDRRRAGRWRAEPASFHIVSLRPEQLMGGCRVAQGAAVESFMSPPESAWIEAIVRHRSELGRLARPETA